MNKDILTQAAIVLVALIIFYFLFLQPVVKSVNTIADFTTKLQATPIVKQLLITQ
jgi:hypothetical protein